MYNREEHYLDDFLRKKLDRHAVEPAEGTWESINSRLGPPGSFWGSFRFYLNQFILPVLTGLIMFSGIAISHSGSDRISPDSLATASAIEQDIPAADPSISFTTVVPVQNEAIMEVNSPEQVLKSAASPSGSNFENVNQPANSKAGNISITAILSSSTEDLSNEKEVSEINDANISGQETTVVSAPQQELIPGGTANTILSAPGPMMAESTGSRTGISIYTLPLQNFTNIQPISLEEKNIYTGDFRKLMKPAPAKEFLMRPSWSIGVYYIPELFYSDDLHGEKQLFAFDATMRYGFYDYFIETGLGISRVRNDNKFVITYNDFLGTYNALDSINFKIDSVSGSVVPNYYWTETMVYDSLNKEDETKSKNYYTYLQLPLYFGYEYNYKRFSLSLKGGPLFSVLIHKKESELYYDEESKRVVAVDDNTPGRLKTNWQLLFYGGIRYRLTNNWSISLEPGVRIYLDQVYENDSYNTRLPYSVNLRTGLLYTF